MSVAAEEADSGAEYGFKAMEILKLDWDLGPPLCCDINGDGLNDIVVVNNRKSRIELLLQKADYQADFQGDSVSQEVADQTNPNDFIGNDTFWRYKLVHYPLDVSVTSLLVSDLNGEGRQDMVYLCPEGLRIVYQEASDTDAASGDMTEPKWRPEISFDIEDALKTAKSLDGGDLNHDGRVDLVVLAAGGYYLCLQNEAGDFEKPVKHFSTSDAIRHLEIGDIDGDGLDDLVLFVGDDVRFPLRVRLQDDDGALGTGREPTPPTSGQEPTTRKLLPADGRTEWFQFKGMAWEDVIAHYAERIGKPLLTDPDEISIGGELTYISKRKFTKQEAIDELNLLLHRKDWRFVETEFHIFAVPLSEMPEHVKIERTYDSRSGFEKENLRDMEYAAVYMKIEDRQAQDVVETFGDAIPDYGRMSVVGKSNKIKILALAKDLRKLFSLYDMIDLDEYNKYGAPTIWARIAAPGRKWATLLANRGCRGKCTFCQVSYMMGQGVRSRSVSDVIDEILYLYHEQGVRHLEIVDDDFLGNREQTLELLHTWAGLNLDLTYSIGSGVLAIQIDEEIAQAMSDAGCIIGLSSSGYPRWRPRLD
ncbi:MAG: VCBS repeat-containing protein [Planctomycetes bacterium]|nr:VCBS repeat-containing protein [Planctomycetota bacterium]